MHIVYPQHSTPYVTLFLQQSLVQGGEKCLFSSPTPHPPPQPPRDEVGRREDEL